VKIVLDTNVLVSAFLKPQSSPAKILRLILQGNIDIVVNECILSEYYEVLTRPKFDINPENVRTVLSLIRTKGINAPALAQSFSLPDRDDEYFLEAALATGADALVTGNKRHFPEKRCKGQVVVSPKEFLEHIYEKPGDKLS